MNLIDFYYYNLGEEPDKCEKIISENTFGYLRDNNYKDNDIMKMLQDFPVKMALTPEDLPDYLWENSLVKRDTFYFHNELHIMSPAPYWDFENDKIITSRFFLEMKIKYTVDDLIKYYYKRFPMDSALIDSKKDKGSMEYLLNKYKTVAFVEPLDFVLFLIDEAVNQGMECSEIIELKRFEKETFEYLKNKSLNAAVEKMNKIIWR